MEIVFMGTGSAAAGVERDNTSLLLRGAEDGTMIDIGGNPLGKLKRLGMRTGQINRLVFTHMHIDHIYGLPSLLWGMWLEGRTELFEIYCDDSDQAWLESWIKHLGAYEWPIKFNIHIRTYEWRNPSILISGGEYKLSSFPGKHGVPSIGLKLEHQGKVAVYSSDTELNERIKEMPHIDLLIHEATSAKRYIDSHSSLQDVISYYDWKTIEQLALVHLTDEEPYEEVLADVPGPIRSQIKLAYDMFRVKL